MWKLKLKTRFLRVKVGPFSFLLCFVLTVRCVEIITKIGSKDCAMVSEFWRLWKKTPKCAKFSPFIVIKPLNTSYARQIILNSAVHLSNLHLLNRVNMDNFVYINYKYVLRLFIHLSYARIWNMERLQSFELVDLIA